MTDHKYRPYTSDTLMEEIAKKYGVDFGEDNKTKLKDFLTKAGYPSLVKLLMSKHIDKSKGGRPTKLTDDFLKATEEVLTEDNDRVLLTDEELIMLINDKLKPKAQIVDRTFQRWKTKQKAGKKLDKLGQGFVVLIKRALVIQKINLLKAVKLGASGWQGSAWVLERKCDEWNLRRYVDHQSKGKEIKQVVGFTVNMPKEETEGESDDGNTDTPTT